MPSFCKYPIRDLIRIKVKNIRIRSCITVFLCKCLPNVPNQRPDPDDGFKKPDLRHCIYVKIPPVVGLVVELVGLDERAEDPLVPRVLQRLRHVRRVAEGDDGHPPAGVGLGHNADRADRAAAPLVLVVQLLAQLPIWNRK